MSDLKTKTRIRRLHDFYSPLKKKELDKERRFVSKDFNRDKLVSRILNRPKIGDTVHEVNELLRLNRKFSIQNEELFYENYDKYLAMKGELRSVGGNFGTVRERFEEFSTQLKEVEVQSAVINKHLESKKKKNEQLKNLRVKLRKKKFLMELKQLVGSRLDELEKFGEKEKRIGVKIMRIISFIKIGINTKVLDSEKEVPVFVERTRQLISKNMLCLKIELDEFVEMYTLNHKLTGNGKEEKNMVEEMESFCFKVMMKRLTDFVCQPNSLMNNLNRLNLKKFKRNIIVYVKKFYEEELTELGKKRVKSNIEKIIKKLFIIISSIYFNVMNAKEKEGIVYVENKLEDGCESLILVSTELQSLLFLLKEVNYIQIVKSHCLLITKIFQTVLSHFVRRIKEQITSKFEEYSQIVDPNLIEKDEEHYSEEEKEEKENFSHSKLSTALADYFVRVFQKFIIVCTDLLENVSQDYLKEIKNSIFVKIKEMIERLFTFIILKMDGCCFSSLSEAKIVFHDEDRRLSATGSSSLIFFHFCNIFGGKYLERIKKTYLKKTRVLISTSLSSKLFLKFSKNCMLYYVELEAGRISDLLSGLLNFPQEEIKEGIVNEEDDISVLYNKFHERMETKRIILEVQKIKETVFFFFKEVRLKGIDEKETEFIDSSLSYGNVLNSVGSSFFVSNFHIYNVNLKKVTLNSIMNEIIKLSLKGFKERILTKTFSFPEFKILQGDISQMAKTWKILLKNSKYVFECFFHFYTFQIAK